jgi:hypothetical protein
VHFHFISFLIKKKQEVQTINFIYVMKKVISLTKVFLTFLSVLCVSLGTFAQSGGSGIQDDPYLLSNKEDLMSLYAFASSDATDGVYFSVTDNINLEDENWEEYIIGAESEHPFRGIFRGNGYKISGFNLESEASTEKSNYYGFFGVVGSGAEITDLHIEGRIDITGEGQAYVGALAGYVREASVDQTGEIVTISNCSSNVIIASNVSGNNYVGGIVGNVLLGDETGVDALITGCANWGNISGNFLYGGGIIGSASTYLAENIFTLSNCYNSGEIKSSNRSEVTYIGGIAGRFALAASIAGPLIIEKSFNTGNVIGESEVRISGIIMYTSGRTGGEPITIRNCAIACDSVDTAADGTGVKKGVWRIGSGISAGNRVRENNYALASMLVNGAHSSSTDPAGANGASKTLDEMQTQTTYEELGWDFTDVWKMDPETNFPVLKLEFSQGTNIQKLAPAAIKTSVIDNTLKVTGLSTGQSLNVYNAQGALIYNAIAQQPEVNLPLSSPGVYIVKAGETSVKIIN